MCRETYEPNQVQAISPRNRQSQQAGVEKREDGRRQKPRWKTSNWPMELLRKHRHGAVTQNKQQACSRKYFLHTVGYRDKGESRPGEYLVPSCPSQTEKLMPNEEGQLPNESQEMDSQHRPTILPHHSLQNPQTPKITSSLNFAANPFVGKACLFSLCLSNFK